MTIIFERQTYQKLAHTKNNATTKTNRANGMASVPNAARTSQRRRCASAAASSARIRTLRNHARRHASSAAPQRRRASTRVCKSEICRRICVCATKRGRRRVWSKMSVTRENVKKIWIINASRTLRGGLPRIFLGGRIKQNGKYVSRILDAGSVLPFLEFCF
jgi:hypothetical protein